MKKKPLLLPNTYLGIIIGIPFYFSIYNSIKVRIKYPITIKKQHLRSVSLKWRHFYCEICFSFQIPQCACWTVIKIKAHIILNKLQQYPILRYLVLCDFEDLILLFVVVYCTLCTDYICQYFLVQYLVVSEELHEQVVV